MGVNRYGLRSIVVRVMAVVLLAGLTSGAIAIYVATRAMTDTAEVKLVEETTAETNRERLAVADRLTVAEAQVTAAALLAEVGRIADVPATISDFVVAIRVRHDNEVLELVRSEAARPLLPADESPQRGRWLVGDYVAVRVESGAASAVEIVDVASLLPRGGDRVATLQTVSGAKLAIANVVVTRDGDSAVAIGAVGGGIELRVQASLAGARAEVSAAMHRAIGWTAAVTLALALVIAWMLARHVTQPIRMLAAAVSKGGGFVPPRLRDDEIGELGAAIAAMHAALAHDAHLLAVGAELARDVVLLQDPDEVLQRLAVALALAHPQQGWRLYLGEDAIREADPRNSERLVVRLTDDGNAVGAAVGHGRASVAEIRSVEVLCHTALAAIKTLALVRAAAVNGQLALLGKLSAGVAHEINNPLAFVSLNLGLLEEMITLEDQRELVRDTLAGVERVAQIVRDLGRLSRRGSEQAMPEDLVVVVSEQLKVVRARAGNVVLALDAPRPVWVSCARGRIGQAVLNLIVNAVDAIGDRAGGRVVVTVDADGGQGVVTVRDNGPGIPEATRRHLFDAFFTTKGDHGTGLGLYLSRQYVQLQGGELDLVESGSAGTAFQLRLPTTDEPGVVEPITRAEGSSRTRRRVLVIDDEPQIVRTLERWLSQYVDVVTASGGRDGFAKFRQSTYSLVLCDLNMPGMSGGDFVTAVRALGPEALDRVVIMTGGTVDENLGVRVLPKPLDRAVIKELLGV